MPGRSISKPKGISISVAIKRKKNTYKETISKESYQEKYNTLWTKIWVD